MLVLGCDDPPSTIKEGEIHVFWLCPESQTDPSRLAYFQTLLCDEEHKKCGRYKFERDQKTCLLARALIRTTLSRYTPVDPRTWRFSITEYGKPELEEDLCELPLRFNLSHTSGLIACAVTLDFNIGVDVEDIHRLDEPVPLAERFFSPHEVRALHRVPENKQRERFFRYWTLKESYIKARGEGLSLGLEHFSFELDEPGPITILTDQCLNDRPQDWQFEQFKPTPNHFLAVGFRRGNRPECTVRSFEFR